MSRATTKAMTPRLRFPEFRDAGPWEVKRLGEVCDVLQGYGFPERFQGKQQGKYPFCKVSDITNAVSNAGVHIKQAVNYVDDEDVKELRAKPIPKGATIFAKIGEALRLNKRAFVETECLIDNNVVGIKGRNSQATDYFVFYLSQKIDLNKHCGGAVPSVNKSTLESIKIVVPLLPEQQKIADCLSSLDDLIRAEVSRLEALQAHKKGLMQQLFPTEGETTPRLRFPEFRDAGPWEVKRLGEVFTERNERNGAELELLSVTMSDGVVRTSDLERRNNASSDRSNYKKVCPNDIVYNSMRMWQGASGVSYWNGIVSPAYTVVTPAENQNPLFWAYYFKLPHTIEQFARFSQGVTPDTWNLKYPAFSTIRISFPVNPCEQQKIADCLSSLDDLIRAQGERIEALKKQKKGLMQQLFPQEVG